jgi:hypothetical protein
MILIHYGMAWNGTGSGKITRMYFTGIGVLITIGK